MRGKQKYFGGTEQVVEVPFLSPFISEPTIESKQWPIRADNNYSRLGTRFPCNNYCLNVWEARLLVLRQDRWSADQSINLAC
jgi:hypothetical protein